LLQNLGKTGLRVTLISEVGFFNLRLSPTCAILSMYRGKYAKRKIPSNSILETINYNTKPEMLSGTFTF
jgi:hypothetical protein